MITRYSNPDCEDSYSLDSAEQKDCEPSSSSLRRGSTDAREGGGTVHRDAPTRVRATEGGHSLLFPLLFPLLSLELRHRPRWRRRHHRCSQMCRWWSSPAHPTYRAAARSRFSDQPAASSLSRCPQALLLESNFRCYFRAPIPPSGPQRRQPIELYRQRVECRRQGTVRGVRSGRRHTAILTAGDTVLHRGRPPPMVV